MTSSVPMASTNPKEFHSQISLGSAGPTPLENVLEFVEATDILLAMFVSKLWSEIASSDVVWSAQCRMLWADKVYVPLRYRTIDDSAALRRIEAYWGSLADAKRNAITLEELCSFEWSSRMKACSGPDWIADDPWWRSPPGTPVTRQYFVDGTTSSLRRGETVHGTWRFVPNSCGKSGPLGCFIRHGRDNVEFPTHFATRWAPNWGWILQNCWGFSASFELPPRGSMPELEDDEELCQSVSVQTCHEEAVCFNLGLPLPHSQTDSSPAAQSEHVTVVINGRRARVPRDFILGILAAPDDEGEPPEAEDFGLEESLEGADAEGNLEDFVEEGGESEEQSQDDSIDCESQDNENNVRLGRVRLLDSEGAFRASFERFRNDEVNGFSEAKLSRLGQEAIVNEIYGDRTVTCVFDDGVSMDFPFESIAEQIRVTDIGVDHTR